MEDKQDGLSHFPNILDVESACDCIRQACECLWWEWLAGYQAFFWCWPPNYVISAKDSQPNYIKGDLLECEQRNHTPEASSFKKVKKKLKKMFARGYISLNDKVKSLTLFFPVPKHLKVGNSKRVPDIIRIVYDATRSGLNIIA